MEKIVYFDHAAATVPDKEVMAFFAEESLRSYANAEAVHALAYQDRTALKSAETFIVKTKAPQNRNGVAE